MTEQDHIDALIALGWRFQQHERYEQFPLSGSRPRAKLVRRLEHAGSLRPQRGAMQ